MERDQILRRLQEIVGPKNVLWKEVDLAVYEYDAGLGRGRPGFVVFTRTAEKWPRWSSFSTERDQLCGQGSGTNLRGTIPLNGGGDRVLPDEQDPGDRPGKQKEPWWSRGFTT
jgi:hypothetical protein